MCQFQPLSRGEVLSATSTIAGGWQIIPDTDPTLQTRSRKSAGEEKLVSIVSGQKGERPTDKPRRQRVREKLIQRKDPSELEWLDPNWLHLPNVEVEGKSEEDDKKTVVQAHTKFDSDPPCAKCSSNVRVTKWSLRKQPRNIKDTERDGKLVLIVLTVQRYFCNSCHKPFTPLLSFLAEGHLSRTERLSKRASALTLERRTSTDIAALTGLSRRTEQDIARKTAQTLRTPQQIFKQVTSDGRGHTIQIDDSNPSRGVVTAILLDGKPLEILKEYSKAEIESFFMTLDLKGRENITCYVSDLANFLLGLGRKYFPGATIVADAHHVIRLLLKDFDKYLSTVETAVVIEYIRAIEEKWIVRPQRPKKGKKNSLPQQNTPETDNDAEGNETPQPTAAEIRILLHTKLVGTNPTQKMALRFLLKRFPDVRGAYCYLQRVMRLYHSTKLVTFEPDASGRRSATVRVIDAKDASRELNRFEARLPPDERGNLITFLNSCRKNRDVICAFWPTGWSNADIESQNGVIKQIDNAARGIAFIELRRQWLYGRSLSAILGREKERVLGKKDGPQKKSILELSKLPPPEPVPVEGRGGQLSLFR
jgi:transposase